MQSIPVCSPGAGARGNAKASVYKSMNTDESEKQTTDADGYPWPTGVCEAFEWEEDKTGSGRCRSDSGCFPSPLSSFVVVQVSSQQPTATGKFTATGNPLYLVPTVTKHSDQNTLAKR